MVKATSGTKRAVFPHVPEASEVAIEVIPGGMKRSARYALHLDGRTTTVARFTLPPGCCCCCYSRNLNVRKFPPRILHESSQQRILVESHDEDFGQSRNLGERLKWVPDHGLKRRRSEMTRPKEKKERRGEERCEGRENVISSRMSFRCGQQKTTPSHALIYWRRMTPRP